MQPTSPHRIDEPVFLRPEVKAEPLVARWYAWSHLVSPAQLALHVAFRLKPLLRSFLDNPAVHISANEDPSMYGGPFVALREEDLPTVAAMLERIDAACAGLIAFANDYRGFACALQEKAGGHSLNDFYQELPPALQGLVELLYDTNNCANIRLFEELLYDGNNMSATQEIFLQAADEGQRPFFMSTPRLPSPGSVSLPMPFSDTRLDALFAMRTTPAGFHDIAGLLGIADNELDTFREFFTSNAPASNGKQHYCGEDVRLRFFGHACILAQSSDVAILFDPFVALESREDGRFAFSDLPDFIDYVVLTHSHQDHFSMEMLIQLRHRIGRVVIPANNNGCITDPSMKLVLESIGFSRIDVLAPFDRIDIPGGNLASLPFTGEHADLNIYSKHAISLEMKDRKFLFLVDSDGRDPALYRRLMRRIGQVDALFLGMECHGAPLNWLYEPLLTKPVSRRHNESRRLSGADCARAWSVTQQIEPAAVFIYAMGQEPWMKYIMGLEYQPDSIQLTESNQFIELCTQSGLPAERLVSGRELLFQHKTDTRKAA